jgi:hypothetical protein
MFGYSIFASWALLTESGHLIHWGGGGHNFLKPHIVYVDFVFVAFIRHI